MNPRRISPYSSPLSTLIQMAAFGLGANQRTARVDIHPYARPRLTTTYLSWVLNASAIREQTIATSRGSTVFHTSPTRMLAACWPLPPISEQFAIVERLEALEREYRTQCNGLREEIELLREYRARLVADVVTGKLDVREAAAGLPEEAASDIAEDLIEEADEPELIDEETAT